MQEEFINVNDESYNPFKSIMKRNGTSEIDGDRDNQ